MGLPLPLSIIFGTEVVFYNYNAFSDKKNIFNKTSKSKTKMETGMIGIEWIVLFCVTVLSWLVHYNLQSKFKKYSKVPMTGGMTGADVALKMLHDNGIYDVKVTHVAGELTDHYNPMDKTVNLSEGVYGSNSIMAAAVAAHECGHAVQHARAYAPLTLRSRLVPVVQFSSKYVMWVLLAGVLLLEAFPQLLLAGILMFAVTTLFSFITLPVEIDASRRALAWLSSTGLTNRFNHGQATDALRSAAYTYVVAALGSLATLLYYVMMFLNRRD